MNRICSPMFSTANNRLPAGSESKKNRQHVRVGARGEKPTWFLANQLVPVKALVLAMFYGVSGTTALAQSYTVTEWIQPLSIPSSGPVTVTGTLGNATASFTTERFGNAGDVYGADWPALLPTGATITNQQISVNGSPTGYSSLSSGIS